MPAVAPKLPSIWNGGCRSKRFGAVRSGVSWSVSSLNERSPSARRAQKLIFQPSDQPVPASPRCSSVTRAASNSSGVSAVIWLLGCRPYRCETCRWSCSGACASQSSCHSCNCPRAPTRIGGSRRAASRASARSSSSTPSSSPAASTAPNRSRRICPSIVGPAHNEPPSPGWCAFSGDTDGQVTRCPLPGSSTRVSRKKRAASASTG